MLRLERRGDVDVVTLDRSDVLNALNTAALVELDGLLDGFERSLPRAVVFTGAGDRAFCAGADVQELLALPASRRSEASAQGQRVFARLEQLPLPTIAAVNGFALGGGLELALACTFRLASPNARLGVPEVKLGLLPTYGGTQRLPRLVGKSRALRMILSGEVVDAQTALTHGLVDAIVEGDPVEAALEWASPFTAYSRATIALGLAAVREGLDEQRLRDALAHELEIAVKVFATRDSEEGMLAFVERRAPEFTDV